MWVPTLVIAQPSCMASHSQWLCFTVRVPGVGAPVLCPHSRWLTADDCIVLQQRAPQVQQEPVSDTAVCLGVHRGCVWCVWCVWECRSTSSGAAWHVCHPPLNTMVSRNAKPHLHCAAPPTQHSNTNALCVGSVCRRNGLGAVLIAAACCQHPTMGVGLQQCDQAACNHPLGIARRILCGAQQGGEQQSQ